MKEGRRRVAREPAAITFPRDSAGVTRLGARSERCEGRRQQSPSCEGLGVREAFLGPTTQGYAPHFVQEDAYRFSIFRGMPPTCFFPFSIQEIG